MGFLIDMINVGEGDSFLVTIDGPTGEFSVLIDAGLPEQGQTVLQYVNQYAPEGLNVLIATHIDNDHVGGMATVLTYATFKPEAEFVFNVPPAIKNHWTPIRSTLERYKGVVSFRKVIEAVDCAKTLCSLATRRGLKHCDAFPGHYWSCGGTTMWVLNPTPARLAAAWEESRLDRYIAEGWDANFINALEAYAEAPETTPENDASIVLEVLCDEKHALMASDAGAAVLKEVTNGRSYHFLKVPHHGSKTGLDEDLIRQFRPVWAAVPVGPNDFGHPCSEILDMLRDGGAKTYCANKTKDCRRECNVSGANISFPIGKGLRQSFVPIDATKCKNNVHS